MFQQILSHNFSRWVGLFFGLALLILCFLGSIKLGLTQIDWKSLWEAYGATDPTKEQLIVISTRFPRALIAVCVGASLAIAGAFMQALTQNPLASPGILGINAGAVLFVVLASGYLSISSYSALTWVAFLGAAISGGIVYGLSILGRGGLTPLKLTLAGAAITGFFHTLTQGVLIINDKTLDEILYWMSGSIVGRKLDHLVDVLPFFLVAWVLALLIARPINTLVMGDSVAKGLGQRTGWVKLLTAAVVILLAGGSVAIAGPISLVGLIIPHLARSLVGSNYQWIIPYCAVLGGIFLLLADIGARYLIMPGGPIIEFLSSLGSQSLSDEVPVGVITALIGVPFFIYIARRSIKE